MEQQHRSDETGWRTAGGRELDWLIDWLIDWCFTAPQPKIGEYVPSARGSIYSLLLADEDIAIEKTIHMQLQTNKQQQTTGISYLLKENQCI